MFPHCCQGCKIKACCFVFKKRRFFTIDNVLQLVLFGKKTNLPKSLWLTILFMWGVDSPEIQLPELEMWV